MNTFFSILGFEIQIYWRRQLTEFYDLERSIFWFLGRDVLHPFLLPCEISFSFRMGSQVEKEAITSLQLLGQTLRDLQLVISKDYMDRFEYCFLKVSKWYFLASSDAHSETNHAVSLGTFITKGAWSWVVLQIRSQHWSNSSASKTRLRLWKRLRIFAKKIPQIGGWGIEPELKYSLHSHCLTTSWVCSGHTILST